MEYAERTLIYRGYDLLTTFLIRCPLFLEDWGTGKSRFQGWYLTCDMCISQDIFWFFFPPLESFYNPEVYPKDNNKICTDRKR